MHIAKKNMIESQLKPEGISCLKTLDCISQINREHFVPQNFMDLSYAEYDIPLKNSFLMLKPLMVAKILQLLKITKNDEVLEIGTGSGFLTCCLSQMSKSVDTMDIDIEMIESAKMSNNNYKTYNINYIHQDIFSNWTPDKNYDVIVITGSVDKRIEKLEIALKKNGRMFVVIGNKPIMNANIIERISNNKLVCDQLFETILDPLTNINKKNHLIF
ncbi:MAG: protein-L-isoaspartate O-methyltransferase [Gammaproteobacteria bacterium]|jgi:protein-L-isoaspartate(D-aspartate) O-methyltransferase|nr:protein-L-isoaspartate O-methyltransferase [Gammaproteobacteria bacterium]MBT7603900.1 protein-L-isoaspartate O-methyltransferase [Gammaproteobacteria bacterium]